MTAEQLPGGRQQPSPAHDPRLTLAGVSRDRTQLYLESRSGARFVLPIDSRLTAAVRGDTSKIGQLEITMDSTLRPRDIQARIRSGETPEAVAKAALTSIERIMPYAAPVLAEREHITQRAQRSSLRRPARPGGGPARTLGDAVGSHLRGLDIDPAVVAWDAWRREDGRWTVVGSYDLRGESGTATYTFDAPGNFVVLEDDDAHWLVGDAAPPAAGDPAAVEAAPVEVPAAAAHEAPEGEAPAAEAPPETRRGLSAVRSEEVAYEQPLEAFLDDRPGLDETELREEAADAAALDRSPSDIPEPAPAPAAPKPVVDEEPPVRRPARKKGARASVPSWDEIMFGGADKD